MIGASSRFSAAVNVMVLSVQKAARGLIRDFGELERLQVSSKGFGNFISAADKRSEEILIAELSKARPDYDILSEETGFRAGKVGKNDFCWVIDPLDGTTNFCHGIPYFAVSVALKKTENIIAGVVYNPITDELFCAEKGKGAFLNNERLRVSGRKDLSLCLVATGSTFGLRQDLQSGIHLQEISKKIGNLRHFGANALDLAYVACGRCDGFFEKETLPWDCSAGILLVCEAGGKTAPFSKNGVIASNPFIHESLSSLLNQMA